MSTLLAYDHLQRGWVHWILLVLGLGSLLGSLALPQEPGLAVSVAGGLMLLLAGCFAWLRVSDEGDHLLVRFGPLPLLRRRVAYADIVAVGRERSSLLDGWGVHWIPGRGWIWNLRGFHCVRLQLRDGRALRIGTDDPEGLAAWLEGCIDKPG